MISWLRNILYAWDVFLCALTGGREGETLSLRADRWRREGLWIGCILCRWFSFSIQNDHCEKAALNETLSGPGAALAALQLIGFPALAFILARWLSLTLWSLK